MPVPEENQGVRAPRIARKYSEGVCVRKAREPRKTIFTSDGYKIVRDEEKSSIPMKSRGDGYYRRKGYQYVVIRPDGSRIQMKGLSQEDAMKIARKDGGKA